MDMTKGVPTKEYKLGYINDQDGNSTLLNQSFLAFKWKYLGCAVMFCHYFSNLFFNLGNLIIPPSAYSG